MKLLDLQSGSASLEFAAEEEAAVIERLNRLGTVESSDRGTYSTLRIDGIELIYVNEWDAPCLISSDAAGAALLERVAGRTEQLRRAVG